MGKPEVMHTSWKRRVASCGRTAERVPCRRFCELSGGRGPDCFGGLARVTTLSAGQLVLLTCAVCLVLLTKNVSCLTCHCKSGDTCDLSGLCRNGCAPGWFGAGCQVGNMAFKKNTSQSSTDAQYSADKAVDGLGNPNYSQTKNTTFPWWSVTLSQDEDIVITNVTIQTFMRSDLRLKNWLILYTGDTSESPSDPSSWNIFAYQKYFSTDTQTFEPPTDVLVVGKQVAIYLNESSPAVLKLFEVYVYGFPLNVVQTTFNATWVSEQICNTITVSASSFSPVNVWPVRVTLFGNTTDGIEILKKGKIWNTTTGLTLVESATSNRSYQLWITTEICLSDIIGDGQAVSPSSKTNCFQGATVSLKNIQTSRGTYEAWTNGTCLLISVQSPPQEWCNPPILLAARCGNTSLSSNYFDYGIGKLCGFSSATTCQVNVTFSNNFTEVDAVRDISREQRTHIGSWNVSYTCDYINVLIRDVPRTNALYMVFVNNSGIIINNTQILMSNESPVINVSISVAANSSYAVWVSRLLCLTNCSGQYSDAGCSYSPERNCITVAKSDVTSVRSQIREYEAWANETCILVGARSPSEVQCDFPLSLSIQCANSTKKISNFTGDDVAILCGFDRPNSCSVNVTIRSHVIEVGTPRNISSDPIVSLTNWTVEATCNLIKVQTNYSTSGPTTLFTVVVAGGGVPHTQLAINNGSSMVSAYIYVASNQAYNVSVIRQRCFTICTNQLGSAQCSSLRERSCLTTGTSPAILVQTKSRVYETWANASCVFAKISSNSSEQCRSPSIMSISCDNAPDAIANNDSTIPSLCNLLASTTYDCIVKAVISDEQSEGRSITIFTDPLGTPTITSGQIAGATIGSFLFAALLVCFICVALRRYNFGKKHENGDTRSICDGLTRTFNGYGTRTSKSRSEVEELAADGADCANIQGMSLPEFFEYAQKEDLICLKYEKHVPNSSLSCEVGRAAINKSKNKFQNIVPYDANRVILNRKKDYINASFINGFFRKKKYIATQGPTTNTIGDFWLMVWEQNVSTIVMLTDFIENAKRKCDSYFPAACSSDSLVQVNIRSQKTFDCYVVTVLDIEMSHESRTIKHYHMLAWKDHSIPDHCAQLVLFYSLIQDLTQQSSTINLPTVLVHCSAGAGRTGTFIAFDWLQHSAKIENRIDVDLCVKTLRAQRMQAVQTKEQYLFLHKAVFYGIKTLKFTFSADFLNSYIDKLSAHTTLTSALDEEWQVLIDCRNSVRHQYEAASKPENRCKNRSMDILASDSQRVFLQGDVDSPCDYINAVYCNGCYSEKGFVVSQIPLQATVNDFWRMVHDIQASCIVLMHNVPDEEDFAHYYPLCGQSMTCGRFRISNYSLSEEKHYSDYDTFALSISQTEETSENEVCELKVNLFVLKTWKIDEATPKNSHSVFALLTEITPRCQDSSKRPVIVQCRNGASHSGMFVCAANAFHRLIETNQVQVFHSVDLARSSRPEFISSMEQYSFIYFLLLQHYESSAAYANA